MTILVSDIFDRAGDILNDEGHIRWPEEELIRWLNDAAGEILNRKPGALSSTITHTLAAGTRQTLPPEGVLLLDVIRNIKADGSPGYPISIADRKALDDSDPNWHAGRKSSVVKQYTHDGRAPREFYVYPPVLDGTKIEILQATLPDPITATTDLYQIGPEYMATVVNYLGYRCFSKDSEFADAQMATGYYAAFESSLGGKTASEQAAAPEKAAL